MKDKRGFVYAELLAIQREHLAIWRARLITQHYAEVEQYVLACNLCAKDDTDAHRVYRGQDLVEIIRTWPDLPGGYVDREIVELIPEELAAPSAADLV